MDDFGIELIKKALPNKVSGILDMQHKVTKIIYNQEHVETRQRFTIAHELGHYLLHGVSSLRIEDSNNYYSNMTTRQQESQANRFAADVLMDRENIATYMRQNPETSLKEIAEAFKVSNIAMAIRLGYPR